MIGYVILCEPDQDSGEVAYRCLEEECDGMIVLSPDIEEHAVKEHLTSKYKVSIEIGFDLSQDDPDPKRQRIRCRSCGKEFWRTEAQGHAKQNHGSDYVYVNLLV